MTSTAIISNCGTYRYQLARTWDGAKPSALFVCLNPSTADASVDDATIRKIRGFAERWQCGGIVMVNLFAYRATQPDDLVRYVRVHGIAGATGPSNDTYIEHAVRAALAADAPIIAARGQNVVRAELRPRVDAVRKLLRGLLVPASRTLECLGRTGSGMPSHPIYLPYETPRVAL